MVEQSFYFEQPTTVTEQPPIEQITTVTKHPPTEQASTETQRTACQCNRTASF